VQFPTGITVAYLKNLILKQSLFIYSDLVTMKERKRGQKIEKKHVFRTIFRQSLYSI